MTTPTLLNQGFVLREDHALKSKLKGIHVPVSQKQRAEDPSEPLDEDDRDGPLLDLTTKNRIVPVYFRLPENEVRRKVYPYITLDFLAAIRDVEREHRGITDYGRPDDPNNWTPDGVPDGGGRTELPIPMQLQYQVTTYARFAQHDRLINLALMTSRLEPRFGFLEMEASSDAPDDHSIRRLDLLSGPSNGDVRDRQGKRIFRKMYTVGVSSELFHSDFEALAAVHGVTIDVGIVDIEVAPIDP